MTRLLIFACLAAASCTAADGAASRSALAVDRPETSAQATLRLASGSFAANGAIPLRYSDYGNNVSPALAWTGVPAGTKTLALMVEDPDAQSARPFVHWLAWNVDPAATLGENALPGGTVQGRNNRGTAAWFGPRPHGSKPHHYHFQLFALDAPLALKPGSGREGLLSAMKGHVLAKGDLVGLFAEPR